MNAYGMRIEIQDRKVKELMDRIDKAQEEIYSCYMELRDLGIITIREETASGN